MGWWLSQAQNLPATPTTPVDQSLTTALIYVLGTVVVALITIGLPLLLKSRTVEPPTTEVDTRIGEKVAVLTDRSDTDRRDFDTLDRHVDGIGDHVDRLQWQVDDLTARFDEHRRRHGES